jgi:hypothetical protein
MGDGASREGKPVLDSPEMADVERVPLRACGVSLSTTWSPR